MFFVLDYLKLMSVKFLLDFRTMKLQIFMKLNWKHFNPNSMSRIDHTWEFISLTCCLRIMHMLSFGELFIFIYKLHSSFNVLNFS